MASTTELVTLARVGKHLNWSSAQLAAQGAEAADFITSVTTAVEEITGPVVARAFDEYHDGGWYRIMLDNSPVLDLTLVSEAWATSVLYTLTDQPFDGMSAGDAYGYTVDKAKGSIIRRSNGIPVNFAAGRANVHVQYTAGYCLDTATVPAGIRQAALEIIRFNWQPQNEGNWFGRGSTDDDAGEMVADVFIPNRAFGQLRPFRHRQGVA